MPYKMTATLLEKVQYVWLCSYEQISRFQDEAQ